MTPVILVHGYLASQTMMRPMQWQLQRQGRSAWTVSLSPLAIQDVDVLATQLAVRVEQVLRETGADSVDLVGVSQGGLVALRYAQRVAHTPTVSRVVTLGSPVRGTWFAAVGVPLLGPISKGLWQLLPRSAFTTQLIEQMGDLARRTTTIAMRGDVVAPPSQCELPGANNIVLNGFPSPFTHQALVVSRRAFAEVTNALS